MGRQKYCRCQFREVKSPQGERIGVELGLVERGVGVVTLVSVFRMPVPALGRHRHRPASFLLAPTLVKVSFNGQDTMVELAPGWRRRMETAFDRPQKVPKADVAPAPGTTMLTFPSRKPFVIWPTGPNFKKAEALRVEESRDDTQR